MDSSVTVSRSFLNRMRAFFNIFASQCRTCLRRCNENCSECHTVNKAKELIADIDNLRGAEEEKYFQENSFMDAACIVAKAIVTARRPIMATEIRLTGVTKQRKNHVLKSMARMGMIQATKSETGMYFYSIGRNINLINNKHNNKGN